MQLSSQRFGGESGSNSIRVNNKQNSGPSTLRNEQPLARLNSKSYFQPPNQMISSMNSVEAESGTNSKNGKSAISVTSVMGQFEQVHGTPNIFAQSLSKNQQSEEVSPKGKSNSK